MVVNREREILEKLAERLVQTRQKVRTGGTDVIADAAVQAHPGDYVSRTWGLGLPDGRRAWVTEKGSG